MPIQQITRERLDQLLPNRRAIRKFIGAEVAWLADPVGNVIGILAEGAAGTHWGYAVLRRNQSGQYQFWDLQTRLADRATAQGRILQTMSDTQPAGGGCAPLVG